MLQQEGPRLLFSLAEIGLAVFEPRAAPHQDLLGDAQVDDVPFVADAAGVHHIELGDPERRSDLVLHDLRAAALADDVFAVLKLADAANVDAAGAVEL